MMSGHGANPIFFNKKIKIGRPELRLTPHLQRLIKSHFCLKPPPPLPPQSGPYMRIISNVLNKFRDRWNGTVQIVC